MTSNQQHWEQYLNWLNFRWVDVKYYKLIIYNLLKAVCKWEGRLKQWWLSMAPQMSGIVSDGFHVFYHLIFIIKLLS